MKGFDERGRNQAGKAHCPAAAANLGEARFDSVERINRWNIPAHMLRIDAKPAAASMNRRRKRRQVRDVSACQLNLFLTGSVIGMIIGLGWVFSH